jgi:3-hydroxybutyryl-CoA dehydrogenase
VEKKIIGVAGSGNMGSGIAQLAASKGFKVILWDMNDALLDKAMDRIDKSMGKSVEKGRMTQEEREGALARIETTAVLAELKKSDLVIEAVIEDLDIKKKIFAELDQILNPDSIIATNTSGISITSIAAATNRPDKVAGMHFFNPAPVMKLVEVIRGYKTSDETIATLMNLAREMGKEPIEVKKDSPGFIVNRIMTVQFIEAIRLVEEGVATIEDIDKAVTLGLNYPMGPFTLQDFGGNDLGLRVMDYFYEEFKDARYAAPQTLRRLVRAGRLGRKTGAGWYDYDQQK